MITLHREILRLLNEGADYDHISTELGIPRDLTADKIRNAKVALMKELNPIALEKNSFGISPNRWMYKAYEFEGDNFTFMSDTEYPDTMLEYCERVEEMSQLFGITRCVHAGDVAAWDQKILTQWAKAIEHGQPQSIRNTVTAVRAGLDRLRTTFSDEYIVIPGNHDERPGKAFDGAITHDMLINDSRYEGWLKFSPYPKVYIHTKRGVVIAGHPKKYNQNPVTLGKKLYNVEHRHKGNIVGVVVPHCHVEQYGHTEDGLAEIICIGTGRHQDATEYLANTWGTFPRWQNSFAILKNGHWYKFNLATTDFDFWRDLLKKSPAPVFSEAL